MVDAHQKNRRERDVIIVQLLSIFDIITMPATHIMIITKTTKIPYARQFHYAYHHILPEKK